MKSCKAFVRYCVAKETEWLDKLYYQNYVAESLYMVLENQATDSRYHMRGHYIDLYRPPAPEKTGEEVLQDLIEQGALEVVNS